MKKNHLLLSFLAICLISSCTTKTQDKVSTQPLVPVQKQMDWMIGVWQHQTEEGTLYEDWTKTNDSTYLGKSYLIGAKDTMFTEHLKLTIAADSVIYESLVHDIGTLNTKKFKGLYDENGLFIVENNLQSFPRMIQYHQLNDTLLMIEISGIIDGEEEIQPFQMTRTKKQ